MAMLTSALAYKTTSFLTLYCWAAGVTVHHDSWHLKTITAHRVQTAVVLLWRGGRSRKWIQHSACWQPDSEPCNLANASRRRVIPSVHIWRQPCPPQLGSLPGRSPWSRRQLSRVNKQTNKHQVVVIHTWGCLTVTAMYRRESILTVLCLWLDVRKLFNYSVCSHFAEGFYFEGLCDLEWDDWGSF